MTQGVGWDKPILYFKDEGHLIKVLIFLFKREVAWEAVTGREGLASAGSGSFSCSRRERGEDGLVKQDCLQRVRLSVCLSFLGVSFNGRGVRRSLIPNCSFQSGKGFVLGCAVLVMKVWVFHEPSPSKLGRPRGPSF